MPSLSLFQKALRLVDNVPAYRQMHKRSRSLAASGPTSARSADQYTPRSRPETTAPEERPKEQLLQKFQNSLCVQFEHGQRE